MQFLDLPFWRQALRGIMAMLCNLIYSVMSFFYDLFNNISQINILTSTDVQPIYQRVTMILTIVMVFYITFQFVKYVVQPDAMTDKEKGAGNIVYKMVIVIVLIAFVPKIFEMAYDVQNAIISKNVISKVILGPQASMDEENLGAGFASSVFNMFYYVNQENTNEDCYDGAECGLLVTQNIGTLKTEGNLNSVSLGLNETDNSDTPLITFEFDGLLAVIVGGLIVYILILYCIDVGVRWVQLLYLQLIAPIPILGYITPKKDGIFQHWVKQCTTTYLDLFLRVAIINIILLLCDTLLKSKIAGDLVPEGASTMMTTLIYVVLIMAVMLFAHKAPKMLAELFPKSKTSAAGNFGLSTKDRGLKGATRVFGAAAGTVVGGTAGALSGAFQGARRRNSIGKDGKPKGVGAGIWGATKGAVGGLAGGAVRGFANGSKKGNIVKNSLAGAQKQMQVNQRFGNREENGYGLMDQMGDRARNMVSARSRVDMLESDKGPIKRHQEINEKIKKANDNMTAEAEGQVKKGKGRFSSEFLAAEKRVQNLQEDQNLKTEAEARIKASQTYRQRMQDIDTQNAGKTAQEIQMIKEQALKQMVEEDVGKQLTQAQLELKKAKDKAIFDFITNGEYDQKTGQYGTSARLESIRAALRTEIEEYNKYNKNAAYSVDEDLVLSAMYDGEGMDTLIKGKPGQIAARDAEGNIKKDASGNIIYVNYNKDVQGINNQIDNDQNQLIRITQHQEAIKRQTSGSGINEGKK